MYISAQESLLSVVWSPIRRMDDTQVLDCTQALPDDFDEDIEEGPTIVS